MTADTKTDQLHREIQQLRAELAAKQAVIDRLMWEHCPEDMTEEQIAEWAKNQCPSGTDHSHLWKTTYVDVWDSQQKCVACGAVKNERHDSY